MEHAPNGATAATGTPQPAAVVPAPAENYSGIWLSRYEFFSSGRDAAFKGAHHVVLLQLGSKLTGRSLDGASLNPDSPLSLDLSIDRNVVTGTWVEQTAQDG